jgi:hypothetical protein
MSMRTVSLCAAAFGAIILAVTVIIQIPMVKKTDPAPSMLGLVIGLIFIIFSIRILYGGKLLTIRVKRVFALIALISSITTVYMNGSNALPWIPAGILFIHVLLPYRQSLYVSAFTIAMTSVALYFHGGETVIGHHIRMIGASMSVLLMMQFIMRNISEIASDSMETTGGAQWPDKQTGKRPALQHGGELQSHFGGAGIRADQSLWNFAASTGTSVQDRKRRRADCRGHPLQSVLRQHLDAAGQRTLCDIE